MFSSSALGKIYLCTLKNILFVLSHKSFWWQDYMVRKVSIKDIFWSIPISRCIHILWCSLRWFASKNLNESNMGLIRMKNRNIKTITLYGQTPKELWANKSYCHVKYFHRLTLYRRIKIVKLSFWYRKRYNLIEKNGTRDKCNREDSFVYLAFLDIRSSWFMPWDLPLQLPFKTHNGSIYAHILYV